MRALSFFLTLTLAACAHHAPSADSRLPSSVGPVEYGSQKLLARGISPSFMDLVQKNYREDQRDKVLELNLIGFIRPNKATGEEPIPRSELRQVQKFLRAHQKTFREAEKKFGVRKEVVASLLWVETRYGRDAGHFHVASSLFSLVQADYPTLLDHLLDVARKKAGPDYDKVMESKIQERARAKGEWAASELLALQEIHQRGWKDARKLRGSFSGAFGMAQFMPSSFISWAKGHRENPNLFRAEDSILSVANYLNSNGWQSVSRESQEGALFHYNRDKAYVTRILKMSECVRRGAGGKSIAREKKQKRSTASVGC